ncbi:hypothetical protein BDW22DRAFT_1362505 [Trametopsis cervina]|nr:hypothetical protein BDW22DRAFT_1362505 [Trametopsis cervina]
MLYTLNADCPVKWTATQEKSISRELHNSEMFSQSADHISRIYQQVLWFPESIMPIDRIVPALLQASNLPSHPSSSSSPNIHPLHELLRPHLLTPRLITDKYYKRVSNLLDATDAAEGDPGDELMWYVIKYEKGIAEDEQTSEEHQAAAEEQWRKVWLSRMEQREIMIQILLHCLLLTLPGIQEVPKSHSASIAAPTTSPKKRKRSPPVDETILSVHTLEQRLELLMDRLAMWQLMRSIDLSAGGDQSTQQPHQLNPTNKGKQKTADDRDWMQIFCEDIVEPLFRAQLPTQCALLRSKVFQTSPFDEDSDEALELQDSPPTSPRLRQETVKQEARPERGSTRERDLARTSSLSITLEEERVRERSRSLSIGPKNIQKRALAREVSMSTMFKGKGKEKQRPQGQLGRRDSMNKSKSSLLSADETKSRAVSRMGTTLVAATPVKSKPKVGRTFSSALQDERDVLPMIIDDPRVQGGAGSQRAIEGGDDDDDWMLQSSPDVLLLTNEHRSASPDLEETSGAHFYSRSQILAQATPTKPRGKS